jgi:hypothetical protein
MKVTWDKYKEITGKEIQDRKNRIYRGQSNSEWSLTTSIHRTKQIAQFSDFLFYFNVLIPEVQEQVESWDGSRRDLTDPNDMAEFMAFLQHNGFPTPLLDWTFSPYIAAYFAFEGINQFEPQSDEIAIYGFEQALWSNTYKPNYNFDDSTQHVSLLRPNFKGNHKQMLQQGVFWFTNTLDPEQHIRANENEGLHFLTKYTISVKERPVVMRDLELMGITAMQLAPSVEAVCKKAFESIQTRLTVGSTPSELEAKSITALPKALAKLAAAGQEERNIEYSKCPECNVKLNPKNMNKHMANQHAK